MVNRDAFQRRARVVQRATAMSYQTCLRLVCGETVLIPRSPDCIVRAALGSCGIHPDTGAQKAKPCSCPRCDP